MATTYAMPTDQTLGRVADAIEAGNALLQRVTGGYVMFTSSKPDESSITTKPCLVVVTTTGEMYLVADDLQSSSTAKQNAWSEEEEESKQNFSWGDEEDEEPATGLADSKAAETQPATDDAKAESE